MSYLRLPPSRPGFNFDSWQKSNLLVVVDLLRIDRRVLSSGNEENLPVGKLQVSESGRSPDHKAAAIYPRSFPPSNQNCSVYLRRDLPGCLEIPKDLWMRNPILPECPGSDDTSLIVIHWNAVPPKTSNHSPTLVVVLTDQAWCSALKTKF